MLNNKYIIRSEKFDSLEKIIVTLHGYGTSGEDFAKVGDIFLSKKLSNTIFLFPDAPYNCACGTGKEWFDLNEISSESLRRGLDNTGPILADYIEKVSNEYKCNNINLIGFSQGSIMALEMIYYPCVSKILAYSGLFVPAPEKEVKSKAKILLIHSDDDTVVPYQNALTAKDELKQSGIDDVSLKTCHNIGHSISLEGWSYGVDFLS